ncbi:MAG: GntR family transcriptional regulator [Ardenticatenaceae bacterium]|nr:GntR family transcriptional regulator [Ardenticatenaceae bacterium]
MLQRSPSLTDQAKSYIKERILNDEFVNGRIPSETILADELQVSRTTIRDALSRLENEGVIFRKQGAGTFVNEPGLQIKTRLEEIWSYEDVIEAHDYTPSTRILGVQTSPAEERIARDLDITAADEILTVKKLFLADEQPVILAYNSIPTKLIEKPFQEADFLEPVYQFLWENGRQRLTYYLSEIIPAIADEELAKTLHIKPQTALISFSEIGYNADNEPILHSLSYFRDDLLRLRLIRRQP